MSRILFGSSLAHEVGFHPVLQKTFVKRFENEIDKQQCFWITLLEKGNQKIAN